MLCGLSPWPVMGAGDVRHAIPDLRHLLLWNAHAGISSGLPLGRYDPSRSGGLQRMSYAPGQLSLSPGAERVFVVRSGL